MQRATLLRSEAPAKPADGAACNGCGVCCAYEPCPIGQLASGRRSGACVALAWDEASERYLCGLVAEPANYLPAGLRAAAPLVGKLARRMIAAGAGCDASALIQVETASAADTVV